MPTLRPALFSLARALARVSGPDARGFLDGVLTQAVDKLADAPLYAALLSPQGKIIADMTLWPDANGALIIEADLARADDLFRRLAMYKLRAQATLERVEDQLDVQFSAEPFDGAQPDPRLPDGALGWRKIAPRDAALRNGAEAYDTLRLKLGVPDLARDAEPEEVFALEALLDELNGVDFKKGCFVGQENVSRMKRRATTRKKFCPITFDGPTPPHGAPVTAGAAELGTVRSGADGRALALLRLDRALEALDRGDALTVDGRTVKLDPPPWLMLPKQTAAGAPD
jgi:folate-binding protein YgfZ